MTPDEVADRLAISDLNFAYVDAVNRRQPELLREVFASDGEWHVPAGVAVGVEEVVLFFREQLKIYSFVVQMATSATARIEGDRATGRVYVREEGRDPEGRDGTVLGLYDDEMVRTPEGWRFQ
ncbi:MAG TPA: nuclear transport factor 2 family protein, partial [Acidimicrobiales bacterium]|nr:nuclear transport factor 2 family protein [Acidimicrobiales bacterium]